MKLIIPLLQVMVQAENFLSIVISMALPVIIHAQHFKRNKKRTALLYALTPEQYYLVICSPNAHVHTIAIVICLSRANIDGGLGADSVSRKYVSPHLCD